MRMRRASWKPTRPISPQHPRALPMARVLQIQAPVAGSVVEQMARGTLVDRVLQLHESGVPLREMAVLMRAGYMSADLEIELTNRKIPFEKWGGLKFLEAAHIKDVLAFLRVSENPRDEVSWYRILMLMPGIGH